MTDTPKGQVPEALRIAAEIACAEANGKDWKLMYSGHQSDQIDAWLDGYHAAQVAALTAAPQGVAYAITTDGEPSNVELRGMWYGAGGTFHGPNVETGTMPEHKLLPFLRSLASHGQAPAGAVDPQLLKFYGVTTDAELIAAQAAHIERLQAKLPQAPSFAPQRVREG